MPSENSDQLADGRNENSQARNVAASSVHKLPPFWKENPKLWFMQVEAIFAISGITRDETNFQYVVANIDSNFLPHICDILESPPADGRFVAVKNRLMETFSESQESKLRRLLKNQELGDQKPSHLLQIMKNLASGQLNDAVLKTLFLEQLPEDVRSILTISQVSDLPSLALQADKIMSLRSPQLYEVTAAAGNIDLTKISRQIEALEKKFNNFSRNRSQTRSDTGNNSKSRNRKDHSEVATIPDYSGISCRLFVKDKLSNRDFLIDTGADVSRKALIDGKTNLQVSAKISKSPSLGITTLVKNESVYNKLLMKYPEVYQASTLPGIKTEHGIYHHIETTGPPVQPYLS
ncbi:uncharacterized protein [Musca autumnalis]|uniref:uncharacterized protein n=1 Tax=Musca autumnalis TaxID=221902 RepID=UPI003CF51036